MNRFTLLAMLTCACFAADSLSQGERDRALSHLHATRKMFLDTVSPLSDAQWKFKPAPDRWSAAEIAEHLALTEDLIFGRSQKLLQGPATPEKKAELKGKDEQVLKIIPDRSQRFQAPEVLRPSGRFTTRQQVVDAFQQSRDRSLDFVRTTQADLRAYVAPHPVAGPLDVYQWMLLMSAHTERHILQMKEVLADPNFPKN
jgi:hypothetical protein